MFFNENLRFKSVRQLEPNFKLKLNWWLNLDLVVDVFIKKTSSIVSESSFLHLQWMS